MGNLFSDFTNLNTSYNPNSFQLRYPCNCNSTSKLESTSPNKPYEIIKNNQLIGYFWYQGNSIDLIFDVSGTITMSTSDNYINAREIANSLEFEFNLYDFRGIKILEYRNNPICENQLIITIEDQTIDNITVIAPISSEISAKLVKGIYKADLIASHPSGYRETIFSGNDAIFEIR